MVVEDVAGLVGQVAPFVGAAIGAYGGRVLDKVEDKAVDAASDQVAGLGRRLLRLVTGRPGAAAERVSAAVAEAAAEPGDPDALAVVRREMRKALAEDAELVEQVRELLGSPAGRDAITAYGERSVAAGSIVASTVITGDVHRPR